MKPPKLVRLAQDRMLRAMGRLPDDRSKLVNTMLRPRDGDSLGYWLQLGIATMLATLGLALNSTAVVIGAMLIAPLMRPLVELAMGLATGSPPLVLRASVRTVASIALVTMLAIAIAWLLPYHSITAELEARTAPTLLDLVVAGGCAVAAAYATVRADADIATTAAGTSVGISLVPPLCATGYALAVGNGTAARGAALLFTANLSGILLVATLLFVMSGFAQVGVAELELALDVTDAPRSTTNRVGRAFSRSTARLGPFARGVPPLLLVAAVYLPLRGALGEIKQRTLISQAVSDVFSHQANVVQYTLDQSATGVVVRAIVVGDTHTATELDRVVRDKLGELDVRSPRISVWSVPDSASLSALAHRVDEIPPPALPEPAPATIHRVTGDLAAAIRAAWPKAGTGEVVAISLDLDHPDRIRIVHLGTPIGAVGSELLATAIAAIAGPVTITEDALVPVEDEPAAATHWFPLAVELVTRARAVGLHACATVPRPPATTGSNGLRAIGGGSALAPEAPVIEVVRAAILAMLGPDAVAPGDHWSLIASRDPCAAGTPASPTPGTGSAAPAP